jgi:hypothetical protein
MTTLTIECPCCRTQVPVAEHPGILVNRRASLSSDIVLLERQLKGLDPDKQPKEFELVSGRLSIVRDQLAVADKLAGKP